MIKSRKGPKKEFEACSRCIYKLREESNRRHKDLTEFILSIERRVEFWGSLMNQTKTFDPTQKILWNIAVAQKMDPSLFEDMVNFVCGQYEETKKFIEESGNEETRKNFELRNKEFETAVKVINNLVKLD